MTLGFPRGLLTPELEMKFKGYLGCLKGYNKS